MRARFASAVLVVVTAALPLFVSCGFQTSRAGEPERSAMQKAADASITAKIKTAYIFNRHLNSFRINVDTDDGNVVLQGAVRSEIEKDLAAEIAKNVQGVKSVRNELKVGDAVISEPEETDRTFSQSVIDATTTASVKMALGLAREIKAGDVEVSTRWGVVTLEGTVPTKAAKEQAERTARETSGVKDVVNKIKVKS